MNGTIDALTCSIAIMHVVLTSFLQENWLKLKKITSWGEIGLLCVHGCYLVFSVSVDVLEVFKCLDSVDVFPALLRHSF